MKSFRYDSLLKLRIEPELRAAIEQAADRDRTSLSEYIRRELRTSLASGPRPDQRIAA